MEKPQSW